MRPGGRAASSRQGKKQVIAFLHLPQAEAAYAKAARDDKSNEDVIGEAVNAVFAFYGMPPAVPPGHRRAVRRTWARAKPRDPEKAPSCRAGRVSYGAWFDEAVVGKIQRLASEVGTSVQMIVEHGLELVTGTAAPAKADVAVPVTDGFSGSGTPPTPS